MELTKIIILAIVTLTVSGILKSLHSEFFQLPAFVLTAIILFAAVENFSQLYIELKSILANGFAHTGFTYLLKVTGICLMTDFVSDFSDDMGYKSMSNAIGLYGRIAMMTCIMPLIFEIIDFQA